MEFFLWKTRIFICIKLFMFSIKKISSLNLIPEDGDNYICRDEMFFTIHSLVLLFQKAKSKTRELCTQQRSHPCLVVNNIIG